MRTSSRIRVFTDGSIQIRKIEEAIWKIIRDAMDEGPDGRGQAYWLDERDAPMTQAIPTASTRPPTSTPTVSIARDFLRAKRASSTTSWSLGTTINFKHLPRRADAPDVGRG